MYRQAFYFGGRRFYYIVMAAPEDTTLKINLVEQKWNGKKKNKQRTFVEWGFDMTEAVWSKIP